MFDVHISSINTISFYAINAIRSDLVNRFIFNADRQLAPQCGYRELNVITRGNYMEIKKMEMEMDEHHMEKLCACCLLLLNCSTSTLLFINYYSTSHPFVCTLFCISRPLRLIRSNRLTHKSQKKEENALLTIMQRCNVKHPGGVKGGRLEDSGLYFGSNLFIGIWTVCRCVYEQFKGMRHTLGCRLLLCLR